MRVGDRRSVKEGVALRVNRRWRFAALAALLAAALVVTELPAAADGPGLPGLPGGPGLVGGGAAQRPPCVGGVVGLDGVTIGGPDAPTLPVSNKLGLTLPAIRPEPIAVDAWISPNPDETFEPIRLIRVRATPMAKILRNGTIDPDQAVLKWEFTVRQRCPLTGQLATCSYVYHEMLDGRVWEVRDLPGGGFEERRFEIQCENHVAFGAPGAPADFGRRLLAAARAQVGGQQLQQPIVEALRQRIVVVLGVPGIALPADATSWGSALPAALAAASGIAGLVGGACAAAATGSIGSEISAWLELSSVATVPADERSGHAVAAVLYKVAATAFLVLTHTSCTAQIAAAVIEIWR